MFKSKNKEISFCIQFKKYCYTFYQEFRATETCIYPAGKFAEPLTHQAHL